VIDVAAQNALGVVGVGDRAALHALVLEVEPGRTTKVDATRIRRLSARKARQERFDVTLGPRHQLANHRHRFGCGQGILTLHQIEGEAERPFPASLKAQFRAERRSQVGLNAKPNIRNDTQAPQLNHSQQSIQQLVRASNVHWRLARLKPGHRIGQELFESGRHSLLAHRRKHRFSPALNHLQYAVGIEAKLEVHLQLCCHGTRRRAPCAGGVRKTTRSQLPIDSPPHERNEQIEI